MMNASPVIVEISGPESEQAARALAIRLLELGRDARSEGPRVIVMEETWGVSRLEYAPGPYDPPEFTAEKILDDLEARGLITLDAPAFSPEEQAEIRERLQKLGYVE